MTEREVLAEAYDAAADEEYKRLTETPLREAEFLLISELLNEYICEGSTIIDIGSGPGRYAEFLLNRKCNVGTIDLSEVSLQKFKTRINGHFGNQVLFSQKDCATKLNWLEDNIADAVLLMGPLYHLTLELERQKAVQNAYRILKPGGFVFAVFMSPYPKLNPMMETEMEMLLDESYINSIQHNGVTNVLFKGFNIEQYRCWPSECKSLMEIQGFKTERLRNIEGIGEFFALKKDNHYRHKEKEFMFNMMRSTCENPNLLGITSQYLYVGKKAN
jgi:ubiquinone/menaquinone biosynthesis C-methylase UbiE